MQTGGVGWEVLPLPKLLGRTLCEAQESQCPPAAGGTMVQSSHQSPRWGKGVSDGAKLPQWPHKGDWSTE